MVGQITYGGTNLNKDVHSIREVVYVTTHQDKKSTLTKTHVSKNTLHFGDAF